MGRSRRVLVVDPDSECRESIVTALESLDETTVETVQADGIPREVTGDDSPACLVTRHAADGPDVLPVFESADHDSVPVVVLRDPDSEESATDLLDAGAREVVEYEGEWKRLLQRRVERALDDVGRRSALDTYETIVETMREGAFVLDEDGDRLFVDERTSEVLDRPATELVDASAESYAEAGIIDEGTLTHYQQRRDAVLSGDSESEQIEVEMDLPTAEESITAETRLSRIDRNGSDGAAVGITRDISERKELERQLRDSELALRELTAVSSRTDLTFEEKVQHVLDIGRERVGLESGFLAVIDPKVNPEQAGFRIVVDDGNDEQFAERTDQPLSKTYCRKTIDAHGPLAVTDATEEGWEDDPAYEKYGLGCYLGGTVTVDGELYGTLCFAAREARTEPSTESERQFVELLTQWVSFELERRRREHELRQLLARINGLIRDVIEVLVESATHTEINERVCDQLAAVDGYDLAWIGDVGVSGGSLEPTAWAGETDLDVADLSLPLDADEPGPSVQALREGRTRHQEFTAGAETGEFAADSEHGLRAAIAVPLTYKDTEYGVMTVYTTDPDAFDAHEQAVLSTLGRAIANAYNAIETGRILGTDQVVELQFTVGDDDLLFNRVAAAANCHLTYAGSVYKPDGALRLFAEASGADAEAVLAAAEEAGVESAACLADEDEQLFEFIVTDAFVELLADRGAVMQALTSEAGQARVTVELPAKASAREFFEFVADRYDGTDLVGYHEHDRPVETRQEFRAALEDRLTDRQQTALQSAVLSGFFEWPRPVSGDELAESMDISRPTFHQHLRAAERKVFTELFDPE
ncbi:bacterio-opsin activator domain-containing protein [Halorientalis brevis]|uniref:Bacterio-opsin activator domain-containing protein n=1 Tax=Halorientalis brevis TaxID=1126241 RepID=A0ABD6CF97_9EURY|nr:bacterio-opsin activator domain-containing protein [Halorientalis brevis]